MKKVAVMAAFAFAVAIAILVAVPGLALADTSEVGKNLGNEVKSWSTTLLLGVAALVSIPVLAKRDINGGLVLALLVMIVGGVAFAPDAVKGVIVSVWGAIAG